MDELTKGAKKLLCIAYKEFIESNQANMIFDAEHFVINEALSKYSSDKIYDFIYELSDAGFCEKYIDDSFYLTTKAISLMENRFKNNLSSIMDFVNHLTNLIP